MLFIGFDEDSVMMHRVRPESEAFSAWADRDLVPTREAIGRFTDIGATGPDQYGNGKERSRFRAPIETTAGKWIDRAPRSDRRCRPIEYGRKSTLLGDVGGFRFSITIRALPLAVRLETLRADEIRMGFAPTRRCNPGMVAPLSLNGTPASCRMALWLAKIFRFGYQSSRLTGEKI